ncbi:MAG: hypothetical protein F4114_18425, partial [Rhodospirillaceae bacterium]|nr:hypothetical protein [Rhodospirillaceae bacterium]
ALGARRSALGARRSALGARRLLYSVIRRHQPAMSSFHDHRVSPRGVRPRIGAAPDRTSPAGPEHSPPLRTSRIAPASRSWQEVACAAVWSLWKTPCSFRFVPAFPACGTRRRARGARLDLLWPWRHPTVHFALRQLFPCVFHAAIRIPNAPRPRMAVPVVIAGASRSRD